MKKTSWVIIGLSLTVLILATALGVVLLQKRAEINIAGISDEESSDKISNELQLIIDSFFISPSIPSDYAYIPSPKAEAQIVSGSIILVGHQNLQMYGVPVSRGLKVYRSGNITSYYISKEK